MPGTWKDQVAANTATKSQATWVRWVGSDRVTKRSASATSEGHFSHPVAAGMSSEIFRHSFSSWYALLTFSLQILKVVLSVLGWGGTWRKIGNNFTEEWQGASLYKTQFRTSLQLLAFLPKVPAAGIPAAADSEGKGRNHDLLSLSISVSRASFQNVGLLLWPLHYYIKTWISSVEAQGPATRRDTLLD